MKLKLRIKIIVLYTSNSATMFHETADFVGLLLVTIIFRTVRLFSRVSSIISNCTWLATPSVEYFLNAYTEFTLGLPLLTLIDEEISGINPVATCFCLSK